MFRQGFSCPALLVSRLALSYRAITFYGQPSRSFARTIDLGLSPFARRYSGNLG